MNSSFTVSELNSTQGLEPIPPQAQELTFNLPHLRFSALTWGEPSGEPLLALHGWLDNAMTFHLLGPELAAAGFYVIAPDLAGHGFSAWRPAGQGYLMLDNCFDLLALADYLGWNEFNLIGHSMGAGIGSMFAGAQPERVKKLVVIDGLGTLTTKDSEAAQQLGMSLKRWQNHTSKQLARQQKSNLLADDKDKVSAFSAKIYASVADAARARMQGVGAVDFPAAQALCQRALAYKFSQNKSSQHKSSQQKTGWYWRSDSRLRHPSAIRFTEEQNLSFMRAIQAPTLYVEGTEGLSIKRHEMVERLAAIKNLQQVRLEGGHHLHLEQKTSQAVAAAIISFLTA